MMKHLWEITHKVICIENTFKVTTKYKDIKLVANACERYFLGSSNGPESIQGIKYLGEVYE
ncbi:hypothetical protein [Oceanobacillus sp. FSL K6-0251]|uniref:hypothetical protein n=1 Tax=Oceanobacillus sp. FSL K6-0251 TaxID=2921602 RepID=UPI0030FCC0A4